MQESFNLLEESLYEAWRSTADRDDRDRIWCECLAAAKVIGHLRSIMHAGQKLKKV